MTTLLNHTTISVSELNAIAKNLLEQHFHGIWVSGEISNLTRASSGHYYFSLKDQNAQIRCALFKFAAARLNVPLKEGDHVEVSGKISIYEARGEFQITVNDIRQIGLGQLFEQYEKRKQQLQNEGLFAPERKQPLPEKPRKIGIITSLAAAALRDVCTTLRRRAPHIPIIVYPTSVQGSGSEQQIAQAIQIANERREVDILILCRGGGSIEDLWAFNEEISVRAVAASKLPIISGVGHETDFTLCDFAADIRAATPTAAAELASPDIAQLIAKIQNIQAALNQVLQQKYQNASQKIDFFSQRLLHPKQKLIQQKQQLKQQTTQLKHAIGQQLTQKHHQFAQQTQTLQQHRPNTQLTQQTLHHIQAALNQQSQHILSTKKQQLNEQTHLLNAIAPQNILQRGYAIVQNTKGKVITAAQQTQAGQTLVLTLAQGKLDVQVAKQQGQNDLF